MAAYMGNPAAMSRGRGNGFARSSAPARMTSASRTRRPPPISLGNASFVGGPKNMGQAPGKK